MKEVSTTDCHIKKKKKNQPTILFYKWVTPAVKNVSSLDNHLYSISSLTRVDVTFFVVFFSLTALMRHFDS